MNTFTPMLDGKRVTMHLDDADMAKCTRGPGYKGIVTDQDTGIQYHIYGRTCGVPGCWCDSEAVPVKL